MAAQLRWNTAAGLLAAALLFGPAPAFAEAPALRMMPDGSKDMYVGLAVASAPAFNGSAERETRPVALLQMQWSSGVFLSGLNLGMHLSDRPTLEFGPLLAIEPGRTSSGTDKLSGIGGIGGAGIASISPAGSTAPARFSDVPSRPEAGAFLNYYFNRDLRLTGSLLYGAATNHDGVLASAALQQSFPGVAAHHNVSVLFGAAWANRQYTHTYFGADAVRLADGSTTASYAPSAGIRDMQIVVNWNWELSSMWLLTSQLSATRLMGDAADSPLVSRRNTLAVRTGLAYRF